MRCSSLFFCKKISLALFLMSLAVSCGVKGPPEPPLPTEASAAKIPIELKPVETTPEAKAPVPVEESKTKTTKKKVKK